MNDRDMLADGIFALMVWGALALATVGIAGGIIYILRGIF